MSDFIRRSKRKRTAAATGNGPFPSKPSTWDFGEGGSALIALYILRAPTRHCFALHQTCVYPDTYWLARGCSRRLSPPSAMAAVPRLPRDPRIVCITSSCPRQFLQNFGTPSSLPGLTSLNRSGFDATSLWHIDAAEQAPSTASFTTETGKPYAHTRPLRLESGQTGRRLTKSA